MRALVRHLSIDDVHPRVAEVEGVSFGLTFRPLNYDPDLPGSTVILDVRAGWESAEPMAFECELEAFVVTGVVTLNGQRLGERSYIRVDPGVVLQSVSCEQDCELLLWIRGHVRVVPVGPDPGRIVVKSVTEMLAAGEYDLVPPEEDVKIKQLRLRRFPEGGSCTDVGVMTKGFRRGDLAVHESDEEVLMLEGWTATDRDNVFRAREYLCWPAGWIHGPVQGYDAVYVEKHQGVKSAKVVPSYARGISIAK